MSRLGHTVVRVEESESTNSLVLGNESYLDRNGLVVVARRQTAGRGRMGRTWFALPGEQLYASIVLHPTSAPADVPAIALITGLAVAQSIVDTLVLDTRLKWPNDVLIGNRKVAGILVESKPGARGQQRLVLGIGVNCQGTTSDAPPDLQERITTLSQERGKLVSPNAVLSAILAQLDRLLGKLAAGHKPEILIEWARRAEMLGHRVTFPVTGGTAAGVTQGITPEGYLVVEDLAGLRHILVSGEVKWID